MRYLILALAPCAIQISVPRASYISQAHFFPRPISSISIFSEANMPLQMKEMGSKDTLSWIRIRSLAYYGPTHDALYKGPISESSIRGVAEDRKRELTRPNTWHWKVVDTDLEPSTDDPSDNGGRTIAMSAWSMLNVPREGSNEPTTNPAVVEDEKPEKPGFVPPELRLDALSSLFDPLHAAQKEIMGTTKPYFMLNSFATHPDHQGRGAGKIMLDWGCAKADEMALPTYLDATGMAKPIYEKRGFEVQQSLDWSRVPWGGEGFDTHYCMLRPKTG